MQTVVRTTRQTSADPRGSSELVAEGRRPLAARPRPPRATQVDAPVAVEAHAFALEEIALHARPEAVAVAAASRGIDDSLPRHRVDRVPAQRPERHPDGA